ncbi:MAG TPA: exodeoxyribonuclease V subunit gamma, partial [Rhodanobacter sp.]|nr:exodeoxyribonuclease V subunit gamma [Rhodanobacter sp.]
PPQAIRHAAAGVAIDGWLDDLRQGDAGWVRLVATASTLVDAKTDVPRHDKLLDAWVVHLLANTVKATSSILIGADATLQLPPLAPDAAAAQLHALFAAVAEGMCQPLPIARRTAFAWLIGPAESAPSRARARYDRGAYVGQGEVADDACLAREWPDFAALHAAGFERWLHLYAPLVAAVNKREASA